MSSLRLPRDGDGVAGAAIDRTARGIDRIGWSGISSRKTFAVRSEGGRSQLVDLLQKSLIKSFIVPFLSKSISSEPHSLFPVPHSLDPFPRPIPSTHSPFPVPHFCKKSSVFFLDYPSSVTFRIKHEFPSLQPTTPNQRIRV